MGREQQSIQPIQGQQPQLQVSQGQQPQLQVSQGQQQQLQSVQIQQQHDQAINGEQSQLVGNHGLQPQPQKHEVQKEQQNQEHLIQPQLQSVVSQQPQVQVVGRDQPQVQEAQVHQQHQVHEDQEQQQQQVQEGQGRQPPQVREDQRREPEPQQLQHQISQEKPQFQTDQAQVSQFQTEKGQQLTKQIQDSKVAEQQVTLQPNVKAQEPVQQHEVQVEQENGKDSLVKGVQLEQPQQTLSDRHQTVVGQDEMSGQSEQQIATTAQPTATSEQYISVTEQHITASEQPTTTSEKHVTTSEQPIAETSQTTSTSEQHATTTEQPIAAPIPSEHQNTGQQIAQLSGTELIVSEQPQAKQQIVLADIDLAKQQLVALSQQNINNQSSPNEQKQLQQQQEIISQTTTQSVESHQDEKDGQQSQQSDRQVQALQQPQPEGKAVQKPQPESQEQVVQQTDRIVQAVQSPQSEQHMQAVQSPQHEEQAVQQQQPQRSKSAMVIESRHGDGLLREESELSFHIVNNPTTDSDNPDPLRQNSTRQPTAQARRRHPSVWRPNHQSLLIRRKGTRELTVTLIPPKIGQPVGPLIEADRQRQMAELAIQERVDAIRKMERNIGQTQADLSSTAEQNTETQTEGQKVQPLAVEHESESTEIPKTATSMSPIEATEMHANTAELTTVTPESHEMPAESRIEQQHENDMHAEQTANPLTLEPAETQATTQAETQTAPAMPIEIGESMDPNNEVVKKSENDPMHQILFGEPSQDNVENSQNNKTQRIQRIKNALEMVHSILWPPPLSEKEIGQILAAEGREVNAVRPLAKQVSEGQKVVEQSVEQPPKVDEQSGEQHKVADQLVQQPTSSMSEGQEIQQNAKNDTSNQMQQISQQPVEEHSKVAEESLKEIAEQQPVEQKKIAEHPAEQSNATEQSVSSLKQVVQTVEVSKVAEQPQQQQIGGFVQEHQAAESLDHSVSAPMEQHQPLFTRNSIRKPLRIHTINLDSLGSGLDQLSLNAEPVKKPALRIHNINLDSTTVQSQEGSSTVGPEPVSPTGRLLGAQISKVGLHREQEIRDSDSVETMFPLANEEKDEDQQQKNRENLREGMFRAITNDGRGSKPKTPISKMIRKLNGQQLHSAALSESREFAESMMSEIERHEKETQGGIDINPARQDKAAHEASGKFTSLDPLSTNLTTDGEPENISVEEEDAESEKKNGTKVTTADANNNSTFTTIRNTTVKRETEKQDYDEESAEESEEDGVVRKNQNTKGEDYDESKEENSLRRVRIGGTQNTTRTIALKDDAGEMRKRRKNKSTGPLQPITTDDVFGTGNVNLPKTERNSNENEKDEDEQKGGGGGEGELPPSPSELPPFEAFPSPPPNYYHRRNSIVLNAELPQLPQDPRRIAKTTSFSSSSSSSSSPTPPTSMDPIATSTTVATTAEPAEHMETSTATAASTSTMKTSTTREATIARTRRTRLPAVIVTREPYPNTQRYVPPRRIFPTRRRTTSTTHPPITVQAPAILPDEETDSSPFDAERAEFLQRLRHLPSVDTSRRNRVSKLEEQDQKVREVPRTAESTEQEMAKPSPHRNNRIMEHARSETHFDRGNNNNDSPFEEEDEQQQNGRKSEIRRKPNVALSFPRQQSAGNIDIITDEADPLLSAKEDLESTLKEIGQHSTPHKDGQHMFLPSVGHRQLKMPKRFEPQRPIVIERNIDQKLEQNDADEALVPMDGETENSSRTTSSSTVTTPTTTKTFSSSTSTTMPPTNNSVINSTTKLVTSQNYTTVPPPSQRTRRVRPRRKSTVAPSTTTTTTTPVSSTTTVTDASATTTSTVTEPDFWAPTPRRHRWDTVHYSQSRFYHMPSWSSQQRENVLTFCSKRAAIRDSANMVIACAGEDGEIWHPPRCPSGTECLPASDSTFRICCPVGDGR